MAVYRTTAIALARAQVDRLSNFSELLADSEFRGQYDELIAAITAARQSELREMAKSAHAGILREFHAEAGFLLGLEIGPAACGERQGVR